MLGKGEEQGDIDKQNLDNTVIDEKKHKQQRNWLL